MSDRVLRGSRLGAVSYESDKHTEFAPRIGVAFDCPRGHATTVPFAADARKPSQKQFADTVMIKQRKALIA